MDKPLFNADLQYKLTQSELLECFQCLDSSKLRARQINEIIIMVLAAVSTVMFAMNTAALNYAVLAVILIITCAVIRYYPDWKYKQAAKNTASENGVYRVRIYDNGHIKSQDTEMLNLLSPSNKFYEGDNTFSLVIGKSHKFCIPKTCLSASQIKLLEDALYPLGMVNVKIDK